MPVQSSYPVPMQAALARLKASPRILPPSIFYDKRGVEILQEIKGKMDDYSGQGEIGLLKKFSESILYRAPNITIFVDYGGSSPDKAWPFLGIDTLKHYVVVDVAEAAFPNIKESLEGEPFEAHCVAADFFLPLTLPTDIINSGPALALCAGFTLCNYEAKEVRAALREMRTTLGPNASLLITIDTLQDEGLLRQAYGDCKGPMGEFVLNAFARMNAEGGANFDFNNFETKFNWNQKSKRVEAFIVSKKEQQVILLGEVLLFSEGEEILAFKSYKYIEDEFCDTATGKTGWKFVKSWGQTGNSCRALLFKATSVA
jgi:L-histidine Nalpha-methyltransferase